MRSTLEIVVPITIINPEPTDAWAEALCKARNEHPRGGRHWTGPDGQWHSETFLEIAKRDIRLVLETAPKQPRADA